MPPSDLPATVPQHVLRFNVSFYNKAAGFYANHSPNSAYFYNNTAFKNSPNFNMLGVASDGSTSTSVGILRNNLAFSGTATSNANLSGTIDDQFNSWDGSLGITVATADFQSTSFAPPASCPAEYKAGGTVCVPPTDTTSFAGMASARQADGSLPVLPFLRLAAGSPLIDKGKDVGLPFVGAAPDLGAFEYGATGGAGGAGGTSGTVHPGTGGISGGNGGTSGGLGGTAGTVFRDAGSGTGGGIDARAPGNGGAPGSGGTSTDGMGGAGGGKTGGTSGSLAAGGSVAATGGSGGQATPIGNGGTSGPGTSGGAAGTVGASTKSGCACAVGARGQGTGSIAVTLLLLALARRRRRRA